MATDWGLCPICKEPGKDGPCKVPEGILVCDGCYYDHWDEEVDPELMGLFLQKLAEGEIKV